MRPSIKGASDGGDDEGGNDKGGGGVGDERVTSRLGTNCSFEGDCGPRNGSGGGGSGLDGGDVGECAA